jgi:hypothetical protein
VQAARPALRGAAMRLAGKRAVRGGAARLAPQRLRDGARPTGGRPGLRARHLSAVGRRPQLDAGAPRLGETDRDRLLRRSGAVLAFTDVTDLLAHELARLGARALSFAGLPARAFDGAFLGHLALLA